MDKSNEKLTDESDKSIKLKELKLEKYSDIPDIYVDVLYKSIIKKSTDKSIIQSNKSNKIDKTTEKYKIALKLINKILKNMNKKPIDDLLKFMKVDRLDIIKPENTKALEDMENDIFGPFNNKKCGYHRKTNNIVLNCFRGMIKQLGLQLTFVKKDITNTEGFRRMHYLYTIL